MAWIIIPRPGTEYGPCVPTCAHRDCAANRRDAAAICRLCSEPIGCDVKCCSFDGDPALVHFRCALLLVDKERAGG